ncbi:MAG: hypothetical protein RJQ09_21285 [Cyclobacteriaceae bacterium]
MASYSAATIELCEILFCVNGMKGKEISEYFEPPIPEKTISRWRIKNKWDDRKLAMSTTNAQLIRDYQQDIQKIRAAAEDEERPQLPKETDQIAKLTNSIAKLQNEKSLTVILGVLMDQKNWFVNNGYLKIAKLMNEAQQKYVRSLTAKTEK